ENSKKRIFVRGRLTESLSKKVTRWDISKGSLSRILIESRRLLQQLPQKKLIAVEARDLHGSGPGRWANWLAPFGFKGNGLGNVFCFLPGAGKAARCFLPPWIFCFSSSTRLSGSL